MTVRAIELREANIFVAKHHRHHRPIGFHKFSLGAFDGTRLVGVAIVNRPTARMIDQKRALEVTRLCTDGTKNACSILYAAAARAGKALGYVRILTYILESEPGTSLRGAGWLSEGPCGGGDWERESRGQRDLFTGRSRRNDQPMGRKVRWSKTLATVGEPDPPHA